MPVLPRDWRVQDAFVFGWSALPHALREHWGLYALFGGGAALVQTFVFSGRPAVVEYGAGLAIFPALAAAMRLIDPQFRMTPSIVFHVIGFWIVVDLATWAAMVPLDAAMRYNGIFAFPMLAVMLVVVWLYIKMWLTVPLYVLQSGEHRNLVEALYDSFDVITGGTWWSMLGLTICIWLCTAAIPRFAAQAIDAASGLPIDHLLAALIQSAGKLVFYVWLSISLLGIASAERGEDYATAQ